MDALAVYREGRDGAAANAPMNIVLIVAAAAFVLFTERSFLSARSTAIALRLVIPQFA